MGRQDLQVQNCLYRRLQSRKDQHWKFRNKTILLGSVRPSTRGAQNGFSFLFKVIKPISKRVSAPEAILAYENQTSEDELQKFNSFYIGKNKAEIRDKGTGRPTKKERRDLEEYKLDFFDWDDI